MQFSVDGHIEQGKIAMVFGQFKAYANRPDMFGLKWAFLTDDPPFVPSGVERANGR